MKNKNDGLYAINLKTILKGKKGQKEPLQRHQAWQLPLLALKPFYPYQVMPAEGDKSEIRSHYLCVIGIVSNPESNCKSVVKRMDHES